MPYLSKLPPQMFWYHIGWFLPDSCNSSHQTLSSIIQNVHVTQFPDFGHSIFSFIICYCYKYDCKYLSLIQIALLCSQPESLALFELLVNVCQLYLLHLPLSSRPITPHLILCCLWFLAITYCFQIWTAFFNFLIYFFNWVQSSFLLNIPSLISLYLSLYSSLLFSVFFKPSSLITLTHTFQCLVLCPQSPPPAVTASYGKC